MGDPVDLARKYGSAIQSTKLHPSNQPSSVTSSGALGAKGAFDLAALDRTIGYTGKANGPVYKYVVGRDDLRVIAMGAEVTTATERHTQILSSVTGKVVANTTSSGFRPASCKALTVLFQFGQVPIDSTGQRQV